MCVRGGMCTAGEGRKVGRSMDLIRRKNPWKRVRNLGTRGQIDVLTFTYLRYRYLLPVFCGYFIVRSVKLSNSIGLRESVLLFRN